MLRYVETLVSSKLQNRNKKCFICHIVYDYPLCLYPYADGFHLFTLLFGPEIPPERSYQIKHMTIEQWWNLDWEFRAVWKSPSLLRLRVLCLFQMAIFSLTRQFVSSFSVTRDLCPRLGRSPHAGKVQLDMSYIWWRGMFWFVFENIPEPYAYGWGSAFVFCCFIQLSLPLNVWMVVTWNFENFAWWIFCPQKAQWDELCILLFFSSSWFYFEPISVLAFLLGHWLSVC